MKVFGKLMKGEKLDARYTRESKNFAAVFEGTIAGLIRAYSHCTDLRFTT